MTTQVKYTVTRGLPWERLIIVKNRYNHRLLTPAETRAYVQTGTTTKFEITTSVTKEKGILLSLSGEDTYELPEGDLEFDVFATIDGVQQPVARGKLSVTSLNNITPLEDTKEMEIRYKQHTDYRRTFTWKDANGAVLTVQSAYMQAKSATGVSMVDLRWFSSVPSESAIAALPAAQRGYLAPATGSTLEMHISDKNNVAAGSYPFDLFVQDSAGDWDCLASGTLVVEASISVPPA